MVANGSDKLIVIGTYAADTSVSWGGKMTNCHILPMETAANIDRSFETEDLKYKAGIDVALNDANDNKNQTTVTETVFNSVKYSVSGSCYAKTGTLKSWEVSIDALRTWADGGSVKHIAIFSRPTNFGTGTAPTTADAFVAAWGEPDIAMPAMISSFGEPANVGESVKVDITFNQAGELDHIKKTTWPTSNTTSGN